MNIPDEIAPSETLVRCLVHPLFYSQSKKRIKEQAFLPPRGKNEVSVLRLKYTDDMFCKNHCAKINIPNNTYCGAALLIAENINYANERFGSLESEIRCIVKSSPIIDEEKQLYLPMHADILYSGFTLNPEEKTLPYQVRALAMELAQSAKFYGDEDDWET